MSCLLVLLAISNRKIEQVMQHQSATNGKIATHIRVQNGCVDVAVFGEHELEQLCISNFRSLCLHRKETQTETI
jgi:hypothetical protein